MIEILNITGTHTCTHTPTPTPTPTHPTGAPLGPQQRENGDECEWLRVCQASVAPAAAGASHWLDGRYTSAAHAQARPHVRTRTHSHAHAHIHTPSSVYCMQVALRSGTWRHGHRRRTGRHIGRAGAEQMFWGMAGRQTRV